MPRLERVGRTRVTAAFPHLSEHGAAALIWLAVAALAVRLVIFGPIYVR